MSEWKDRVCIITGASSGIGVGIAIEFAKQGSSLALVGRNERNLNSTAEKCRKAGLSQHKILCIVADLSADDATVKAIVTKTIDKFGKINVLVNNAGFGKFGALGAIDMKDYDEMMRVNVRSVVYLSQEAVPYLIKTKGNIVNISSIAGRDATPQFLAYCMSKAALDHFTSCGAQDLAAKGVRINSIRPGPIMTKFADNMGAPKEIIDQVIGVHISKHPMGRIGTIEEIARATLFIASDASAFTTGQAIAVDGGGRSNY